VKEDWLLFEGLEADNATSMRPFRSRKLRTQQNLCALLYGLTISTRGIEH
jgi:hypothetical protein